MNPLMHPDTTWYSNAVARIEQTINTIQRMSAEASVRLPNTGASDVLEGAARSLQKAKEKLTWEHWQIISRESARD